MKLTLTNLGRIREAELDLRPLTVLVGPNNTNKSWAAYAAYNALELSAFNRWGTLPESAFAHPGPTAKSLEEQCAPLLAGEVDRMGLLLAPPQDPDDAVELEGEELAMLLGVEPAVLERANASCVPGPAKQARLFTAARIDLTRSSAGIVAKIHSEGEGSRAVRVVAIPDTALAAFFERELLLLGAVTRWRCDALPVERQLLFTSSLLVDEGVWELQLPAQDFLDWVNLARARTTRQPGAGAPDLVALLHERVFGGEIRLDPDQPMQFEAGGVAVPVQAAASMVRSLAPLSLWLDRLARPGDVLVIDEPEMNAHPRAQLALAELFCLMIRRGYRLILTTHSPYLVEHLATLMEASRLPEAEQARVAPGFLLQRPDAFLDPEQVAVYEFGEVTPDRVEVQDVLDRDAAVIDTRTFARWTNRMSELLDDVLRAEEE